MPLMDVEEMAIKSWADEAPHRALQCSCKKCMRECVILPGAYSPFQLLREIKKCNIIAKNDDRHILSKVVQDYRVINGKAVFYLRPALETEEKAQRVGATQIGKCSNLGPNGCMLSRDAMPLGCLLALPCRPELRQRKDIINLHIMWLTKTGLRVIAMFELFNAKTQRIGCDASFQEDFQIESLAAKLIQHKERLGSTVIQKKLQELHPDTAVKVVMVMNVLQKIPQMAKIQQ